MRFLEGAVDLMSHRCAHFKQRPRHKVRRVAVAALAGVVALAVSVPAAFAVGGSVLGLGNETVVVEDELSAGQKFSESSSTGDEASSSSLSTPATRNEIVVKQQSSAATVNPEKGVWMTGTASHYGIDDGFMGGTCADGSIVTETSMGIAMRTVPLGSKVEISYNGKSVIATVVDRGPYHGNRVIDMQPAVARALGTVEAGVVTVQYRVL